MPLSFIFGFLACRKACLVRGTYFPATLSCTTKLRAHRKVLRNSWPINPSPLMCRCQWWQGRRCRQHWAWPYYFFPFSCVFLLLVVVCCCVSYEYLLTYLPSRQNVTQLSSLLQTGTTCSCFWCIPILLSDYLKRTPKFTSLAIKTRDKTGRLQ